jgi:hypothetical protein
MNTSFDCLTDCSCAGCRCSEELQLSFLQLASNNYYLSMGLNCTSRTCLKQLHRTSRSTEAALAVPDVRSILMECQDVKPCFRGNGVINGASLRKTTHAYREFLMRSVPLRRLSAGKMIFPFCYSGEGYK